MHLIDGKAHTCSCGAAAQAARVCQHARGGACRAAVAEGGPPQSVLPHCPHTFELGCDASSASSVLPSSGWGYVSLLAPAGVGVSSTRFCCEPHRHGEGRGSPAMTSVCTSCNAAHRRGGLRSVQRPDACRHAS